MPDRELISDAVVEIAAYGHLSDLPLRHEPRDGLRPVEVVGPGATVYMRDLARELKACRVALRGISTYLKSRGIVASNNIKWRKRIGEILPDPMPSPEDRPGRWRSA